MKTVLKKNRLLLAMMVVLVATSAVASAATKLTISTMPQLGNGEWHQAGIEVFRQLHPDIEVEVVFNWADALITSVVGGQAPDLIHYDGQYLLQFVNRGLFMDLSRYVERDLDLSKYFPTLIEAVQYKGGIWALPRNWSVYAQVYNATIFEERGVAPPDETWTWDDLIEKGKRLTYSIGDGPNDKVYGFAPRWGASNASPMWLWMGGGRYWNDDYTESLVNTPEAERGFQFLVDVFTTHGIGPHPDTGYRNPDALFQEGRIAMTQVTRYTRLSHPMYQFAAAPISAGPAGRFTSQVADVIGIFPGTKAQDAAWEFLKFLASEEGHSAGRELGREYGFYWGLSPIRTQAVEQLLFDAEPGFEAWLNMIEVGRRVDRIHPLGFSGPVTFVPVARGEISMSAYLENAANNLNAQIRQALEAGQAW